MTLRRGDANRYPSLMLISVHWLNRLLEGDDLTAEEADRALTSAGFPIEGAEDLGGGDTRLDVEITSNRGDCLCHLGLAREIAAVTGRKLTPPDIADAFLQSCSASQAIDSVTSVDNRAEDVCPRFTTRLIRGVRVGPSPAWLVKSLEAVSQRSINNIVDASNYVLLEMGNPSHAFDFGKLTEGRLIVRRASEGETLISLEGAELKLKPSDVVVADAQRAVSLAGVIGGLETAVTEGTTDALLEVATWDPVTIRTSARRLRITTDASHRFERMVDLRTLDLASARLASLVVELAGGELIPGVIDEGAAAPSRGEITLRRRRCCALIGVEITAEEMTTSLGKLAVEVKPGSEAGTLECAPPVNRPDLTREIDLIEEVARIHGYDSIPINERISLEVVHPQESEQAERALGDALCGLGFFETVTFSFVTKAEAERFLPGGCAALKVDEERRKGAPYLRPSALPSLLACRRVNQDAGADLDAEVRLFETASGFWERPVDVGLVTQETRWLAMLMDAPDKGRALRQMRGVIETIVELLGGSDAALDVAPIEPRRSADTQGAVAKLLLEGAEVGVMTLISDEAQRAAGLDEPVVAAEIAMAPLLALYPPNVTVASLPAFPSIERDLSVIVDESVTWEQIAQIVATSRLQKQVGLSFVGVYRGKQIGADRKSVSLRLRFRDEGRTLRREEVEPQIESLVIALRDGVGASLRA